MTDGHRTWAYRTWLSLTVAMIGTVMLVMAIVMIGHNRAAPVDAGALSATATSADTSSTHFNTYSTSPAAPEATTETPHRGPSSSPAPVTRSAPTSTLPIIAPSQRMHRAGAAPGVAAGRPAILHLPALTVTAAVDPVDNVQGVLQVPDDISRVGWWRHSAPPGSAAGSTVIDGHIDSEAAGAGALFHLAELNPGELITISTTTGAKITYRVQARRVYRKAQGLPVDLFAPDRPSPAGHHQLRRQLRCHQRSYDDNIVIYATAQIN